MTDEQLTATRNILEAMQEIVEQQKSDYRNGYSAKPHDESLEADIKLVYSYLDGE